MIWSEKILISKEPAKIGLSADYITWEQVREIRKKNAEEFYNKHPEYKPA